jgi:molybdopterin converting factor small subunit
VQKFIQDRDRVEVNGSTVGECLDDLIRQFPGIEKWIFDEHRQLLRHVFVYVNAESARKADLAKPVKDKDELIIALLITGG